VLFLYGRSLRGEVPLLVGVEEHLERVHTGVNILVVVQRTAGAAVDERIRAAAAAVHRLQSPRLRAQSVSRSVCMRSVSDERGEC
jgi:hypothetical protein